MNRFVCLAQFQDESVLLAVLTQMSSMGGKFCFVIANGNHARIAVDVPDQASRHFLPRLRQIIGVIELVEVDKGISLEADAQFDTRELQSHCPDVESSRAMVEAGR